MKSLYHDELNHIDILEVKSISENVVLFATQLKDFLNSQTLDVIENKMKHLHLQHMKTTGDIPWTDYIAWIGNNYSFKNDLVDKLNLSNQAIMVWEFPIFDELNRSNFAKRIDLTIIDNAKCYMLEFTYNEDPASIVKRSEEFVDKMQTMKDILEPATQLYKFVICHKMDSESFTNIKHQLDDQKRIAHNPVSYFIFNDNKVISGKKMHTLDIEEMKDLLSNSTKTVETEADFEMMKKNWINMIDYLEKHEEIISEVKENIAEEVLIEEEQTKEMTNVPLEDLDE